MQTDSPSHSLRMKLFWCALTTCLLAQTLQADPPKKLPRDRPCQAALQQIADTIDWEKIGTGPTHRLFRAGAALSDRIYAGDVETKLLAESLAQLPTETTQRALATFAGFSKDAQVVIVAHARKLSADKPRLERFLSNLPSLKQTSLPTRPIPPAATTKSSLTEAEWRDLLRTVETWEASLP